MNMRCRLLLAGLFCWLLLVIARPPTVYAQAVAAGTVNAQQKGTWTVQPGNTANTTAWLVNVGQVNGIAVLTGNGVTGTGSQRVTIASDNTAFTVNAAQSGTWTVQPGNTANTTAWLVTFGGNGTFFSGQAAVTATAAALAANTAKSVCVKALVGNTINVYIGASGVTTATGWELAPGDATCLALNNSNLIFVIASTTGASVSFDGYN